ncbi:MAG: hypothetical protein ACR2NS_12320 [Gemmatimonadaceae bacterium]
MRKLILIPALLCGMTVTVGAQSKLSGRLSCAKPTVREAGGTGAEMVVFQRSNCNWTTPFAIDGSKPGRTVDTSIGDITGSTGKLHGYSTSVMDNGDSTVARFEGTSQQKKDGTSTDKGTWRYVRGTGKFAGISGSGTFKGAAAADGSSSADISGHYSLRKVKAK